MPALLRRSPPPSGLTITRSCSIWISSFGSCTGPMLRRVARPAAGPVPGTDTRAPMRKAPRCCQVGGPAAPRGCTWIVPTRRERYRRFSVGARIHPLGLLDGRVPDRRLREQVPAEVRHRERDLPALGGEHQPLLQQAVPGGRERRGACGPGGRRCRMSPPARRGRRRARPSPAGTPARPGWPARTGSRRSRPPAPASASGAAIVTSGGADRAARRGVPGRLAVGLHEVGVAARGRVQRVQRVGVERRRPPVRPGRAARSRRPPGRAGRSARTGTAARSRTSTPTAPRAGAAARPRPPPAARATGTARGRPRTAPRRRPGRRSCISSMRIATPVPTSAASSATSVNSSTRSISMSPESARPLRAARRCRAASGRAAWPRPGAERRANALSTPSTSSTRSGRAVPHGEVADRPVQRGGQRAAQVGLRPRLDLAGAPAGAHGHRPQLAEQHGLAHPAQSGEHQAALRSPAGDPLEHDLERVDLAVPPGQLRWPLAGAGGERVAHRIHASHGIGDSWPNRRTG